jgi:DNA-binding IclR family transcriptional regulator
MNQGGISLRIDRAVLAGRPSRTRRHLIAFACSPVLYLAGRWFKAALGKPMMHKELHAQTLDGMIGAPLPLETSTQNPETMVKSAARVLEIFEFFYRCRRPARAVEISEFLDLPKSSTNGLLKTLVETGYVTFNKAAKTYFPSFRIVRFGSWLSSFYFGPNLVLDLMTDLHATIGECVALTVQNDCHMQFVAMLSGPGLENIFREGRKTPIIGSATGGALLATMRDADIVETVLRALRRRSARTRDAECQGVVEMVHRFRRQGFAVSYRSPVPGTRTVAMALPEQAGNVPLVLSVGGAIERVEGREEYIAATMRTGIARYLR